MNQPGTLRHSLQLFLVAVVLCSVGRLSATSYYVDYASGSDANNGTSTAAPWQHCPGDPAATGMPAGASLTPGDTVFFKGGVSYVLTGTTGIQLAWNGTAGSPITYDGNLSGAWGTGRANFTDNYGAAGLAAFSASGSAAYLAFTTFDFGAIGGSATLPSDLGSPVPARPGTALAFNTGASHTTIDNCVFHDLGYAYNQQPMNAASIAGTGVALGNCDTITISNCDFSAEAVAIEMRSASSLNNVTVTNCSFHDSVCWTIDLPPLNAGVSNLQVSGCTESNNSQFSSANWLGYGPSPRTDVQTANAGANVTFNAASAASPAASYQWQKNGAPISGATNASLSLSSVSSSDAGTYTVVATNSAGATVSNDAILNVVTPTTTNAVAPVITTQPVSTSAPPLGTASFSVAATGSPTPTYQWLKNGVAISGWTNSTLTIQGVTTNDVATYSAIATNSAGSVTSDSATLTIATSATAPTITTQPASQSANAGANVSFTVGATGSPAPTYQWLKNGTPIAGATSSTLSLTSVGSADAATYAVNVTNTAGTVTSNGAILTVNVAPTITTQPVSQTVGLKSTVTFSVAANGVPAPTYQWYKDGVALSGATSTSYTIRNVSKSSGGTYTVVVTNVAGSVTSNAAVLTISGVKAAVTSTSLAVSSGNDLALTAQPASETIASGTTATFSVAATGNSPLYYTWFKDDAAIGGATGATLTIPKIGANDAGNYTVTVTDALGSITSDPALLSVAPAGASSALANLSVRADAGSGDRTLIVGFVINGSAAKSVLMRGVGPSLAPLGVANPLASPVLSLYSGSTSIAQNAGWNTSPAEAQIAAAAANLGAFALSPSSDDSALLPTLTPGAYTASVTSSAGQQGTALLELYDSAPGAGARFVNASVRTLVGGGSSTPIIGFVVTGTTSRHLLVRAIGPSLAQLGVNDTNPDPQVQIFQGSTAIQQNDNWGGSAALTDAFTRCGAFPLNDPQSKDSAVLFTAAPGQYTAIVSGVNDASGVVLLEIYDLP